MPNLLKIPLKQSDQSTNDVKRYKIPITTTSNIPKDPNDHKIYITASVINNFITYLNFLIIFPHSRCKNLFLPSHHHLYDHHRP